MTLRPSVNQRGGKTFSTLTFNFTDVAGVRAKEKSRDQEGERFQARKFEHEDPQRVEGSKGTKNLFCFCF